MTTNAETNQATESAVADAGSPSTLAEAILTQVRQLPVDRQQQVLDFVEFLRQKHPRQRSGPDLFGALAHLGVHITEEDIAEARREMWGNFPRELPE